MSKHQSNNFTVRLFDVVVPDEEMKNGHIKSVFLVMNYFKMSLRDFLNQGASNFNDDHIKVITYNLLCALNYIHSTDVLHRDIKPSNIMI